MNFALGASLRSWLQVAAAAGVLCVIVCGCNSDPTPITSQTSKYEAADGEASGGAATDSQGASTQLTPADQSASSGSTPSRQQPAAVANAPANVDSSATESGAVADQNLAAQAAAPSQGSAPKKPSATPPTEVTSPPKSNDPKELLAYMHDLMSRQPRGTTQAEKIARFQETQQEIVQVADRILSAQADDPTTLAAAEGKLQAWVQLSRLGHPDAKQELQTFVADLLKSKNPEIVMLGRRMNFAQMMATFDGTNDAQTKKLLSEFKSLFGSEKKDESLFMLGAEVARLFIGAGKEAEALEVMKTTHAAFADEKQPPLSTRVAALAEEMKFVELNMNARIQAYVQNAPNSEKELLETLDKLFAEKDAGARTVQIAMQLVPMMETRSLDAAAHVYEQLEKAFANSPDTELATMVKNSAQSFSKRRTLIGKPFVVEGVTLQGTPFDWSKLKGKIVLVDFWATWCGPCLEELPNIRQNYDQYHEQGFEVVGVNIDQEPEAVQRFFSQQQLPWATVRSSDPNKPHPLLDECGIEGIPFLVLVGRDGNVLAINTRGEKLGEKLAELIPADPNAGKGSPAKQPAKNKTSHVRPQPNGRVHSAFVTEEVSDRLLADESPAFAIDRSSNPVAVEEQLVDSASACDDTEKEPNPYLASPGLNTKELIEYLFEMQDKPRSIQERAGFAAAVSEAADRILAGQASDKEQVIAIQAKFSALHQAAVNGDTDADKQLVEFAEKMKDDKRESVANEVRFIQAERKATEVRELPADKIDAALDELKDYFQGATLTQRHLRMASVTVEAINKIVDKELREKRFKEFGDQFAKSEDKTLSRYGARIAEPSPVEASDWIGKPLQLTGTTTLGAPLDWASYRKKVVIVDIWATWCGPCREQMPRLVALHEKLAEKGFDVVGVSVDKDTTALQEFLAKNEVPWTNVSGQEAFDFAKTLGVRGIPTMLLVDRDGKVVATSHSVDELAPQAEKLLETP